jgi:predicted AAA+ superfamily ATPase
MEDNAPCVILIDELVAYIRQFPESGSVSGGSYDTNLSFVQALTEATKLVPTAIVLAALPESEVEAGSQRGVATLKAMEKTFGRIQALWKPVATEEAFEIIRRRLFDQVSDEAARDAVCRAFADVYVSEGVKMPSETQESRYYDRLVQAYPIHPAYCGSSAWLRETIRQEVPTARCWQVRESAAYLLPSGYNRVSRNSLRIPQVLP